MELKPELEEAVLGAMITSNRTLWNWNLRYMDIYHPRNKPLIVPYGIETQNITAVHR